VPTAITDRLDGVDRVIDADVHLRPPVDDLLARLPERHRRRGLDAPGGNWPGRGDSTPTVTPATLAGDHLDPLGVDDAVVVGCRAVLRAAVQPDRRYAAALTRAYNDWLFEEALADADVGSRLHGTVAVPANAPEAAAEEIRRVGDRPGAVGVVTGGATQVALGQERYWPIYRAAASLDLPVAIHAGAEGYGVANPDTGAGYPGTAIERRSVAPSNFMGQLLSLVLEGPFVEFPDLRVVVVGAGHSWVPQLLWRIDKMWRGLTDDYPWIERPPSEYVRERVRFATAPIAERPDPERAAGTLEMLDAGRTLLFGSDYPYSVGDRPPGEGLGAIDPAVASAVFGDTAASLYGL